MSGARLNPFPERKNSENNVDVNKNPLSYELELSNGGEEDQYEELIPSPNKHMQNDSQISQNSKLETRKLNTQAAITFHDKNYNPHIRISKEQQDHEFNQLSESNVNSSGLNFLDNLISSLSVAFINLPMCMAFASAAKLSPTVGIISAFWSSMFIAFSDSKYSIISVAMSIALLTGPLVISYGEQGYLFCLFMSGIMMMVILFSRMYKYMIIIPKCVMDGFMTGCVLGILKDQLPIIFSIPIKYDDDHNLLTQLIYGLKEVISNFSHINWFGTCLYFSITIILFILVAKYPSKPWVLGVCILAILIGYFEDMIVSEDKRVITLAEQYKGLQLKFIMFPNIGFRKISGMLTSFQFYLDALSMSIVLLLETMITLGMMGISTDQSYTSQPRNIMTLVFSNLSCLVTGSMASSFVYARSYLNHQTGAKNQWSCVMNGVICLAVGFLLFNLFAYLPSVALEAILMGLELKTIRINEMIFTFKNDKKLFMTNIIVIFSMLFTRPSNAILIGLFCYLAMLAKELMIPQNEITYTKISTISKESSQKNNNLTRSSKYISFLFFPF